MIGELPTSLNVCGMEYPINSDFRAALTVLIAFNDKKLRPEYQAKTMLDIIYDFNVPPDANEAMRQAVWFLDGGDIVKNGNAHIKTMDYKQDEPLLFSAVNRIAGREIRDSKTETHWWTFLGFCAEISPDSPISHIVHIRHKRATGKKLEKHEQEFYRENKHLIDFKSEYDEHEQIIRYLRG